MFLAVLANISVTKRTFTWY